MTTSAIALPEMPVPVEPARISVVICCYTDARWILLLSAIESALYQTLPSHEVVVVVDHNPGLAARLRNEALPAKVRIVENGGSRGLSGARNCGIEASHGELLVFLDDDASASPRMLEQMAARMADASILGVVSAIRPAWEGDEPRWFPAEFLWAVGCTYRGLRGGDVRNLIGASMAIRRAVFRAVGGFDSGLGRTHASLPLGCEETELCIRARRGIAGRFVFDPGIDCVHAVPRSRARFGYLIRRCWAEGLSKARLAHVAGPQDALQSEMAYVTRTLPAGIAAGLRDALLNGDPAGIGRAATIVCAFVATGIAYARQRVALMVKTSAGTLARPGRAT